MAKKQVKRWYVRRVAKFEFSGGFLPVFINSVFAKMQRVAITHEGLKALEQAKKNGR